MRTPTCQIAPRHPAELDRYLTPAEKIVFRTRLHWVRITGPWTVFFLALLAARRPRQQVLPRSDAASATSSSSSW